MNYYNEKMMAFNCLESMIIKCDDGIDPDLLIYQVTKKFRIGERSITKRLDLLKKIGKVEEFGGVLIWKEKHLKNASQ